MPCPISRWDPWFYAASPRPCVEFPTAHTTDLINGRVLLFWLLELIFSSFYSVLLKQSFLLNHLLDLSYWDPQRSLHTTSCTSHASRALCLPHIHSLLCCASIALFRSSHHAEHVPPNYAFIIFLIRYIISSLFQITWVICVTGFVIMLVRCWRRVCNQFSEKLWKACTRIFFSV